jgi:hypothetical protein
MRTLSNLSYEACDAAEAGRLLLQLEAQREALVGAQDTLQRGCRDIAFLIEDSSSPDEFRIAAQQCRDMAVQLERLAGVWESIENELRGAK